MLETAAATAQRAAATLVTEARRRRPVPPSRRELITAALTAASFAAAAAAFATLADWQRPLHARLAVGLVVAFAAATNVELEIASGSAVPTQLVFVPMLFLLPLPLVPAAVAAGYVLGGQLDALRRHAHPLRSLSLVGCSWFALPPALLLALAGSPAPRWSEAPILLAALAAQSGGDAVHTIAHERLAHGIPPAALLQPLATIEAFDALLSPAGLLVAVASTGSRWAFLGVLPFLLVVAVLAGERRSRIDAQAEVVDLADLAYRDAVTGLTNRRGFDARLAELCAAGDDEGPPFAVCLIDLDRFKEVNDRLGHAAGDELLHAAARAWSVELRQDDVLARVGGDEFALLLPRCTVPQAAAIAERVAAATPRSVTCSVGLARADAGDTPERLLQRADAALYRAKRGGRDRLVLDEVPA